jgi:alpha-D-ribose 1-methylphosphonate 5-triphosphate diphosphatase
MTRPIVVRGGAALIGDALEAADIRIEDGRIAAIGDPPAGDAVILDARGLRVLPAMVDIHGDAFERVIMPRDDVFVPDAVAILETDRQLAANGIGTAYHALTLSWEPGLRSVARGADFMAALGALEGRLGVDNRTQLRWETFAFEAVPLIERALAGPKMPAIAFNDHTTMAMRAHDVPLTRRPRVLGTGQVAALSDERVRQRSAGNARRAGLDTDSYVALLAQVWARQPEVNRVTAEVAAKGRAAGAPMLSHDDSSREMRAFFAGLGADIAEFPMCAEAAREAAGLGGWVVLGSPNVIRGGSHIGSLDAAAMVEAGVCNILASDYYYPAMLAAAARLVHDRRAPFAAVWATVARNPALASGLPDRGEIALGRRADLLLVDWQDGSTPAVRATIAGGRIAHLAGDLLG